jgi:hypothetical protein
MGAMTLSIKAPSIMTLSIKAPSITTLSIKGLLETLSIIEIQHKGQFAEQNYNCY